MISKPRLLVVDDDEDLRGQMRWALADEYEVCWRATARRRSTRVRDERPARGHARPGAAPASGRRRGGLRDADADAALADAAAKVVVITGREERDYALRAVDQGAYDYFVQADRGRGAEGRAAPRALAAARSSARTATLRQQTAAGFEGMLGTSPRHAGGVRADPQGRDRGRAGAGAGRERHRQGAAWRAPIHRLGARADGPVRADQLRRDPRGAARERAVRPREGRVHGRPRAAARAGSRRRTAARCSSTRSASCRRRCR